MIWPNQNSQLQNEIFGILEFNSLYGFSEKEGGCGVTLVDETGEAFHKDSIIGSCLYQLVMKNLSIFGLLVLGSALLPCKLFYSLKFMFSRPWYGIFLGWVSSWIMPRVKSGACRGWNLGIISCGVCLILVFGTGALRRQWVQLPFMMECMLVLLTNSGLLGGGSAWTWWKRVIGRSRVWIRREMFISRFLLLVGSDPTRYSSGIWQSQL